MVSVESTPFSILDTFQIRLTEENRWQENFRGFFLPLFYFYTEKSSEYGVDVEWQSLWLKQR